jgi:hypothetical protein
MSVEAKRVWSRQRNSKGMFHSVRMLWFAPLVLVGIEQLCYYLFLPYPYRLGVPIRRLPVEIPSLQDWQIVKKNSSRLAVSIRLTQEEVFLRRKYPFLTAGPHLFIGHVSYNPSPTLTIRTGWLSILLVLALAAGSLFGSSVSLVSVGNSLCLMGLGAFLYLDFARSFAEGMDTYWYEEAKKALGKQ